MKKQKETIKKIEIECPCCNEIFIITTNKSGKLLSIKQKKTSQKDIGKVLEEKSIELG